VFLYRIQLQIFVNYTIMENVSSRICAENIMKLPPSQEAIRASCFHPNGLFVEFAGEEIEQSIFQRFETIARRYPDRIAIKTNDLVWNYAELDLAVDQLARTIAARSHERGEIVAVLLDHGADLIAVMLAIWKAGKTYVPLDSAQPPSRNRTILENTQAQLLVTNSRLRDYAAAIQKDIDVVDIDEPAGDSPLENFGAAALSDDSAYILFTSGSAGTPKGVVQSHRNLLHQIKRETNGLHICADDGLILLRSCSAIGGVRIVLSALLNGAAVYPFDLSQTGFMELAELLARGAITIYDSTPTCFRQFVTVLANQQGFPDLRLVRLSSEPVQRQDVELYKKHFSPACIFVNSLGLTETTGSIRHYFVDHDTRLESEIVPVGYAVEDMDVLLLDDDGREVGPGGAGEIVVRSRYLSPGYWRQPDLTRAKFFDDPVGNDRRSYLSGDLGQLSDDGCLVHLGRKDFQVKVRGYTLDIGTVERALLALDSINAAAVMAEADLNGDQSLMAFAVPATNPAPTISSLRRQLSQKLPEYMIPASFVMLDSLPTTPTGKIDRRALPARDRRRPALDAAFVAPRSALEGSLADIWREVLHIDDIGIEDNFFDLGGDSLRVAEVNRRLQVKLGVSMPLVDMFSLPTIRSLAEHLRASGRRDDPDTTRKGRNRAETRRALAARRKGSGQQPR
jgi:amino acid adenylation domain-containing protein